MAKGISLSEDQKDPRGEGGLRVDVRVSTRIGERLRGLTPTMDDVYR